MKLIRNILFCLLLILVYSNLTFAYLDCTPSSCPTGYVDNGTICEGGSCVRQCITHECAEDWTEVHNNNFGWNSTSDAQKAKTSTSYTPTNLSQCFKFYYNGAPTAHSDYIRMYVIDPPNSYSNCDSEGIGGFRGAGNWLDYMANYTGDTGNGEYNDIVKAVRGHSDTGSNVGGAGGFTVQMAEEYSIYCSPNISDACSLQYSGEDNCDNDCYNKATNAYVTQGYFKKMSNYDQTLYNDQECWGDVPNNRMNAVNFTVYSSSIVISNVTSPVSCERTNEVPNATNVLVSPSSPNAGENLECTFDYYDAEGFLEKDSVYEWWKNGVNQSINSRILKKGNLTINDIWGCRVMPGDGVLLGTQNTSLNNVTILTTVSNPEIWIESNKIWNNSDYWSGTEEIYNFTTAINDYLSTCTADPDGYCNVTLNITSDSTGSIDLSDLKVYYELDHNKFIYNLTNLNNLNNNTINEFVILNNDMGYDNFTWSFDSQDPFDVISNLTTNISNQTDMFVIVQEKQDYSSGNYTMTAKSRVGDLIDSDNLELEVV